MKKHFSSVEQIYRQNAHQWRAPCGTESSHLPARDALQKFGAHARAQAPTTGPSRENTFPGAPEKPENNKRHVASLPTVTAEMTSDKVGSCSS